MKFKAVIRQGDVFLFPVDSIPSTCKPIGREGGRVVLAHGEVTGHAHAFENEGVMLMEGDGENWLKVNEPSTLKHEEHKHVEVKKGLYKVVRQREYSPEKISYVRD